MLGSTATDVVHGRLSTEDMEREKRGKRRQNSKIRALLADPIDQFIDSVVSLYTVEVVECCWSPGTQQTICGHAPVRPCNILGKGFAIVVKSAEELGL
jgi:hypothetical protein